jgi:hypothetical protein
MEAPTKPDQDQPLREIISKGVNMGFTFTSAELFGEQMTLADVAKLVAPLDRNSCLRLLASLNWHRMWVEFTNEERWHGASDELDALITQFLPPPLRLKARLLANDENFAGPVSEIALLTLAGLLCRTALKTGGIAADTQRAQRELFRALLNIQGGISGKSPDLWEGSEMFSRTTQVVWRNISVQNMLARDLARLHAYLTIPEVGAGLSEPVSHWLHRHLGVGGEDYQAIANSLHGAASLSANFSSLFQRFPGLEPRMSPLIKSCSTTPDALAALSAAQLKLDPSDPDAISEAQVLADAFFRYPLLRVDGAVLCISSRLLFNRLHRGLHYLVVEPYQGDTERIKQVRAECGKLFERYIVWLLRQFLPPDKVEIIHSFRIKPIGKQQKGIEPPERDIAVISGKCAFVFEIKSAIPTLANRRRANVDDFVKLFGQAVDQAVSSADALLHGSAFRDVRLTQALPKVETVIPCVVCFEPSPLRFPVALEFEETISKQLGNNPFTGANGRLPVQIFDVEGIEEFGDLFGLPQEWKVLLNSVARRAWSPHLRYKPLRRDGSIDPTGTHSGSSALPKLLIAARAVSEKRWRELTRPNA